MFAEKFNLYKEYQNGGQVWIHTRLRRYIHTRLVQAADLEEIWAYEKGKIRKQHLDKIEVCKRADPYTLRNLRFHGAEVNIFFNFANNLLGFI